MLSTITRKMVPSRAVFSPFAKHMYHENSFRKVNHLDKKISDVMLGKECELRNCHMSNSWKIQINQPLKDCNTVTIDLPTATCTFR